MTKLGTHNGQQPTNLGTFLEDTYLADSPVPMLFALDNNIAPTIADYSPTTKLIFRTQIYGPDNGNMYAGDPIAAGRARVDQCLPTLRQNAFNFAALDNEPGRSDVEGLTWLCNYYLGEMQRADEVGIKLCIGEWSTGMPPLSADESTKIVNWLDVELPKRRMASIEERALDQIENLIDRHSMVISAKSINVTIDYISIYTPMLRYAMAHGHILGLHEYSLSGPMIGSPLCLRYRTFHDALPLDARPMFAITEAGPGAGYGTGYTMQPYIDVVAAYDAELMRDSYVLGVALFRLGKGESNMAEVMPLLTQYVIDHPTPEVPPVEPPTEPPITSESGSFAAFDFELFDSEGNAWELAQPHQAAGYAVLKNDAQFAGGWGEALLYYNDRVYVTNAEDDPKWFVADANGWTPVAGDPRDASTPPIDPPPNTEPPVYGDAWRGLHMRADGGLIQAKDIEAAKVARCDAIKLFQSARENYDILRANHFDLAHVVVRPGHIKDHRATVDEYINANNTGIWDAPLREAEQAGAVWIEPWNEPDLVDEGYGGAWTSITDFCNLYNAVVGRAKNKYPKLKFLSTALAQQPARFNWWAAFQAQGVFALSDGLAAHCYWASYNGQYPMNGSGDGRSYRDLIPYLTGAQQIWITEASNNATYDSDDAKGRQYAEYLRTLESTVRACYFFCASASDEFFNKRRETWVRGGALTAIPAAVGA